MLTQVHRGTRPPSKLINAVALHDDGRALQAAVRTKHAVALGIHAEGLATVGIDTLERPCSDSTGRERLRRKLCKYYCSLGLPDQSVGSGVDADALVQVQVRDDPVLVAAGRVDAVTRERHLFVDVPPAAAAVERCGGAVGHDGDERGEGVFG